MTAVQNILLKFYYEVEMPSIIWSDNGGQFKSIVEVAVERSLGIKPKHIPAGRPESNGLTETFNRVLDTSHGGIRSKLMQAVAAYNSKNLASISKCLIVDRVQRLFCLFNLFIGLRFPILA